MLWIIYAALVLLVSGVVGLYLGRFREAYTEMTGMMAGMTMGMLNGFLLGYAAAAFTNSMFWGNLVGIILGLALGAYFGRAGSLMGVLDGGMGGVMGGSMGAMLAAMLIFPAWTLLATALLLAVIYAAGMFGLVLLIERSAPQHAALHRLLPQFTRAIAAEAAHSAHSDTASHTQLHIPDYYALLGVGTDAGNERIAEAYLAKLASAGKSDIEQLERALATLTDPHRRAAYNKRLDWSRPAEPVELERRPAARAAGSRATTQQQSVRRTTRQAPQATLRAEKKGEPPISWVGVVAGFGLAALLVGWWLVSQGGAAQTGVGGQGNANAASAYVANPHNLPADFIAKLEAQAVVPPAQSDGTQTIDLVVNGDTMSYKPNTIKVKAGVPVHFNITTEGRDPG